MSCEQTKYITSTIIHCQTTSINTIKLSSAGEKLAATKAPTPTRRSAPVSLGSLYIRELNGS